MNHQDRGYREIGRDIYYLDTDAQFLSFINSYYLFFTLFYKIYFYTHLSDFVKQRCYTFSAFIFFIFKSKLSSDTAEQES